MSFNFDREYKEKEIKQIINSIVVLVDSREKVNSHIKMWLKYNKIGYMDYTLDFGDYSFMILKNESLGILDNVYFTDEIVIERKANAEEISGNFAQNRERFKREFERSNGVLRLLIEDTNYADICEGKYRTEFPKESFVGSLHSFQEKYNCPFFFTDKEHSGRYIYNTFKYYLKDKLKPESK
jgi:ERCC4-type nuclease